MEPKKENEKIYVRLRETADDYMDRFYSQSYDRRNLLEFTVGILSLIVGGTIAAIFYIKVSPVRYTIVSILIMLTLLMVMLVARKNGRVEKKHYFVAFLASYCYGFYVFAVGGGQEETFMFGLLYPLLAVYILKPMFGNILIAMELVTYLILVYGFKSVVATSELRVMFIILYVFAWQAGNVIEKTESYMEKRMSEQQKKLAFYADYDQLTSLYNRRRFYERVGELHAKDSGMDAVSVLILDIDNFKSINDTYGHNVGDEVLAETAARLRENSRSSDVTCRWGGEEFLILGKVPDKHSAMLVGKKICDCIGTKAYRLSDGRELKVTASVGIIFEEHFLNADMTDLIHCADEQLYKAKRTGKNRSCFVCHSITHGVKNEEEGKEAKEERRESESNAEGRKHDDIVA